MVDSLLKHDGIIGGTDSATIITNEFLRPCGFVGVNIPLWVYKHINKYRKPFLSRFFDCIIPNNHEKMMMVIELSYQNILHKEGGPFAAAIFSNKDELISVGTNLVLSKKNAVLHAEMVAILMAGDMLSDKLRDSFCLYSSAEPCMMCMGAIKWSGIQNLVYGANDSDIREIGFDEGIKPENWQKRFKDIYGISTTGEFCRNEAVIVLNQYKEMNGTIY